MYDVITLKSSLDLKRLVLAAFPDYRKQKATLSVFNGGVNINSYWDGGSRSEYRIVDLHTLRSSGTPSTSHPYFDVVRAGLARRENDAVSVDSVGNVTLKILPAGYALVAAGTFCGKPATAHVYLPAENMPRFLPAGTERRTP